MKASNKVLSDGFRTGDIMEAGKTQFPPTPWAIRLLKLCRDIGEGRGNLSEERFPPLPQAPSSLPPKTFDFIESLLAVFPDMKRGNGWAGWLQSRLPKGVIGFFPDASKFGVFSGFMVFQRD